MSNNQQINGASRRTILQTGATTIGILGMGVGTVAGQGDRRDGNALVLQDAHREGVPFTINFRTAFPKVISCNRNSPKVEVDCYDILYDDGEGFELAFETAASEQIDTAVRYQLGELICATGQGDWHVTSFRKA